MFVVGSTLASTSFCKVNCRSLNFIIDIAADLVSGFLFNSGYMGRGYSESEYLMITTILVNLFTATLITLRILYQIKIEKMAGGLVGNSPLKLALVICLESSALIVVITVIFLVISHVSITYMLIPMQLLVHVYVSLQASCRLFKKTKLIQMLRSCHHFLSFSRSYGAGP